MNETLIGYEIKKMSHSVKRAITKTALCKDEGIKPFHMEVIAFVGGNNDPVFQRDIEKKYDLKRATVSLGLDDMEKKGLINRVAVKNDARLKQIILTDKATELFEHAQKAIMEVESYLVQGLEQEEIDTVIRVFNKIEENAKKYLGEI